MYDGTVEGVFNVVSRPNRMFLWAGSLIALNLLLLAFTHLRPPNIILVGFFLGTAFGHTTLAAAWTALGPLSLARRLPFSLAWMVLLWVAIATNVGLNGGPNGWGFVFGACLLGQWLLLPLPLASLSFGFGLRLRHADSVEHGFDRRELQFGIRQLIIVTAIVGVVLGIGRAIVTQWIGSFSSLNRDVPVFIFLGVASVVLTLPLILAALMRHFAIGAVALVLVLIGLATAWELPLLRSIHGGPGPDLRHFISINVFTAAVILLVLTAVRLNGYYLSRSQPSAKV